MKNLMSFLAIAMLAVMVMTSCELTPVEPTDDPPETIGKLRLVPLSSDNLSKTVVADNGNRYLPAAEIGPILARASDATISFGEMPSTRTLMYVVMNVGDRLVFDVTFEASDLIIVPNTIGFIQIAVSGTEVAAYPIISITKEHVLPISGVGQLLEMSTGLFSDTLNLTYHYTLGQDIVEVVDPYTYDGVNMGTIVDILASGSSVSQLPYYVAYHGQILIDDEYHRGEKTLISFNDSTLTAAFVDTTIVINSGNTNARIRICSRCDNVTVLDTTLNPTDTLNISGIFTVNEDAYYGLNNQGNIIKVGPTEYVVKLADVINLTGMAGLEIRQ